MRALLVLALLTLCGAMLAAPTLLAAAPPIPRADDADGDGLSDAIEAQSAPTPTTPIRTATPSATVSS